MKESKLMKLSTFCMIIFAYFWLSSCEKKPSGSFEKFHGIWISTDLADTLDFRTENDLYTSVTNSCNHFKYSILSEDSIRIQYNGCLYILIQPTNHYYHFNGSQLIIDLEHCYGFRNQKISFIKR